MRAILRWIGALWTRKQRFQDALALFDAVRTVDYDPTKPVRARLSGGPGHWLVYLYHDHGLLGVAQGVSRRGLRADLDRVKQRLGIERR